MESTAESEDWRQSEQGCGLYIIYTVIMIITYGTLHSSPREMEATSPTGMM